MGRLDNGVIFDQTISQPFAFRIGIGKVIKGWDLGISDMRAGGQRRLVIPSDLAYGKQGAGPKIPPNSRLTFDVELVGCT